MYHKENSKMFIFCIPIVDFEKLSLHVYENGSGCNIFVGYFWKFIRGLEML
jgi:hypothetical protein